MDVAKTGSFIARLRKEQGLTQKELAQRLLVSDKAISRWEAGHGMPDLDNLEALSREFDVGISELLHGERFEKTVATEEAEALASDGVALFKELLKRRTTGNILIGFLVSLVVLTLAVVHLASPIPISYREGIAKVEKLADGTLVAIAEPGVAGIDVETVEDVDNDGIAAYVSCHTTRLAQLTGSYASTAVVLGSEDEVKVVYYYPNEGYDVVLYAATDHTDCTLTLPRLIYGMWLAIGVVASIVGLIVLAILRKRWYARRILKVVLVPICLTLGVLSALWLAHGEIYNAAFYLSGILLVAAALYGLALLLLSRASTANRVE